MTGVCNLMRQTKVSVTEAPVSCPNVNDMGGCRHNVTTMAWVV